jgi:hypothetical protein
LPNERPEAYLQYAEDGERGKREAGPAETLQTLELAEAEARMLANVMIAEGFRCGQGGLDRELWDLRDRVYFGDAEAMRRVRELYRESRQGRRA